MINSETILIKKKYLAFLYLAVAWGKDQIDQTQNINIKIWLAEMKDIKKKHRSPINPVRNHTSITIRTKYFFF